LTDGERRLAAIMFTDMVGYTALGQRNESLSLALVDEQRKLIRPILARHDGREVKTIGDAFLVEFPNALDAVRCAYDIQRATREFNISLPTEKRIHLRVGLHLGDVIESQGDISGDAVNVASRIEPLAEDGGVCLTRQVYESTHNKFELPLVSIGTKSLKNVGELMEVYKMEMPWMQPTPAGEVITLPRDRIAILPFANMSPDANDEYFADSITDEIITTTSGISGLSVISRTSVMGYKGTTKRVKEIGRELEVGSVLEGSFKKAGNRIRVTTQLIDVANDKHIWAQNYDRQLDDIFAVQSDIAKQVADALRVRIMPAEQARITRAPTSSSDSYILYLKGRHLWNERTKEGIVRAISYFERAVTLDPTFALGYAGLADCYHLLAFNFLERPETNYALSKENVQIALRLDGNLAEAHTTLAAHYASYEFDFDEAEREYKKAIELKPSYSMAHHWYHMHLRGLGRWDQAGEEIRRALELDPFSMIINVNLAEYFLVLKKYDLALEQYKKVVEMYPESELVHGVLLNYYLARSSYEDFRREFEVWTNLPGEKDPASAVFWKGCLHWLKGEKKETRKCLAEIEARRREWNYSPCFIGESHIVLGEIDEGFEWLEQAYRERDTMILFIKGDWQLDGVRSDQRYLDLVKRLGLE
jgi:adenylate cyclase